VVFRMSALLCDLDGTLADTLPGIAHSVREAVAEVLPGAVVPDLRDLVGPPVRDLFALALGDLPLDALDALEASFRRGYDDVGWRMCAPFPGVAETLATLRARGVRCFVATNKPATPTGRILAGLGLERYFEEVVAPDSRDPRFASKSDLVEHLLHAHALDRAHAVLVGDAVDDARAAHEAGIAFAAAAYGYGDAATHPALPRRWSLASFGELLDLREGGA
jgi:phosphoglycolate phosphatase